MVELNQVIDADYTYEIMGWDGYAWELGYDESYFWDPDIFMALNDYFFPTESKKG